MVYGENNMRLGDYVRVIVPGEGKRCGYFVGQMYNGKALVAIEDTPEIGFRPHVARPEAVKLDMVGTGKLPSDFRWAVGG